MCPVVTSRLVAVRVRAAGPVLRGTSHQAYLRGRAFQKENAMRKKRQLKNGEMTATFAILVATLLLVLVG